MTHYGIMIDNAEL